MKKNAPVAQFGFTVLLLLASAAPLFPQEYPRGAILDEARYNSLPRKAAQISRGIDRLPQSASLKQYAPNPGNQGRYGTCTAWAAAYAARTIAESVALNRRDRHHISGSVFSPAFIYRSISDDPLCQRGTAISRALDVMKDPGAPRMTALERSGDFTAIPPALYRTSQKFPIAGYVTLFHRRPTEGVDGAGIQAVKKSLSQGKPVIIGMNTPDSFNRVKTSPWVPAEDPGSKYGGHALCVTGYDDSRYGGAFEIQNSWGEDWGEKGSIWISYGVFSRFVYEAYELIEDLGAYRDSTRYSGFVNIEVLGSPEGMPVTFDAGGYYRTRAAYPSGTRFRLLMGNDHPAWVYAFTADDSGAPAKLIFPLPELNESPALDYTRNAVAWPGENDWMELDNTAGTDYLGALYSKQALDIAAIIERFNKSTGAFPQRAAAAAGSGYVTPHAAQYEKDRIRFTATVANQQAILGLFLAIEHSN
ncbi:MAG: C1 family peptidase [Treponema sp.]|jgi:hypothetical protein|nr:C1 family peptidase [Treponema sp.]